MKRLLLGLTLAVLPLASASAATFEANHKCTYKDGCAYVYIDGEIQFGDEEKFFGLIKKEKIDKALVVLNSPGGNLLAALRIGAFIHEYGLLTFVPEDTDCASACADIWLSGKVRYVSETAHIGFHRAAIINKKGKFVREAKEGNAVMKQYFERLGLTERAIHYLLAAGPKEATWLSAETAYDLGIIATSIPKEKAAEKEEPKAGPKSQEKIEESSGASLECAKENSNGSRCAEYKMSSTQLARCQDANGHDIVCGGEGGSVALPEFVVSPTEPDKTQHVRVQTKTCDLLDPNKIGETVCE